MSLSNSKNLIRASSSKKSEKKVSFNYGSLFPEREVEPHKLCDICGCAFQRPSHLKQHKKLVHNIEPPVSKSSSVKYKCRVCDKSFAFLTSRWKHERSLHKFKPEFKHKVYCGSCEYICRSKRELMEHITQTHPEIERYEELTFKSLSEFHEWKEQTEKDTVSSFVTKKMYETKSASVQIYCCHRSGYFKSTGKGIRKLKSGGSNKIGSFCPANIRVEIDKQSGNVLAKYFPTHLGHDFEVERLRLSKLEKDKIAEQIYDGVPISTILSGINKLSSPTKRLALANWQDVRNIALSYGLTGNKKQNDISEGKLESQSLTELKEEAVSAIMSFVPEIEKINTKQQCEELIKCFSVAKHEIETSRYHKISSESSSTDGKNF